MNFSGYCYFVNGQTRNAYKNLIFAAKYNLYFFLVSLVECSVGIELIIGIDLWLVIRLKFQRVVVKIIDKVGNY